MSSIRHLLAVIGDSARADTVLALTAQLARRHRASAGALHAVEPVVSGAYLSPEAASVAIGYAEEADRSRREAAERRTAAVADRTQQAIAFDAAGADPLGDAARRAHTADLVVLSQPLDGDGVRAGFAASLLLRAGRPLLFVPAVDALRPAADGSLRCGSRAIVAWSDTRESARALADALPLLAGAERVELLHLAPGDEEAGASPLAAAEAYLQRHGIRASARRLPLGTPPRGGGLIGGGWTPDVPVAEALLSHAADSDADLIVMGGYGHGRAWEQVLGGVTKTMLRSMTVPVLMSH